VLQLKKTYEFTKRCVHWHKTRMVNKMLDDRRITPFFNGIQRSVSVITEWAL